MPSARRAAHRLLGTVVAVSVLLLWCLSLPMLFLAGLLLPLAIPLALIGLPVLLVSCAVYERLRGPRMSP